jgi:hypothetical protein
LLRTSQASRNICSKNLSDTKTKIAGLKGPAIYALLAKHRLARQAKAKKESISEKSHLQI